MTQFIEWQRHLFCDIYLAIECLFTVASEKQKIPSEVLTILLESDNKKKSSNQLNVKF